MPQGSSLAPDRRRQRRLKLPPMYTLIRVRPRGTKTYCWTGHIYDISASGLRFELDAAVATGTEIEIRAALPGCHHTTINASGHVVRYHDEPDDPGPIRMGMIFDKFTHKEDLQRLTDYLNENGLLASAA